MSEQPAAPRFVSITMQEEQGVFRFLVIDLNCLDTLCESKSSADADAIAEALNARADHFPDRFITKFDKWPKKD